MTEKIYDKNMPFIEVLQKAVELKAHLIVKTSYVNEERQGAWYIKTRSDLSYEDIKAMIEYNVQTNTFSKRVCYLIKYD